MSNVLRLRRSRRHIDLEGSQPHRNSATSTSHNQNLGDARDPVVDYGGRRYVSPTGLHRAVSPRFRAVQEEVRGGAQDLTNPDGNRFQDLITTHDMLNSHLERIKAGQCWCLSLQELNEFLARLQRPFHVQSRSLVNPQPIQRCSMEQELRWLDECITCD